MELAKELDLVLELPGDTGNRTDLGLFTCRMDFMCTSRLEKLGSLSRSGRGITVAIFTNWLQILLQFDHYNCLCGPCTLLSRDNLKMTSLQRAFSESTLL
jgi:hypothetical protein